MAVEIVGRKLGMTQIFNESGDRVPVTVIQAGPCKVVQKKTADKEGYSAVQLGFEERKEKGLSKAMLGHFARSGVGPLRHVYEIRLSEAEVGELEVGQELGCALFEAGQRVDLSGVSKGRGFSGVIRRHNFSSHKETHGTHESFRHGGSMSSGTYPGRIRPGKRMAGQYGNTAVTTLGLQVERIDAERNLIFVRGSVPGARNGLVRIRRAV